jgi:hypothetical protein
MFTNPLLLIAGIVAFGLVAVVAPIVIDVYRQYRYRKVITCPESHGLAEVTLNAGLAALGAAVGRPVIRVKRCSLWPKREGCDENCVAENWPELH